MLPCIGDVLLEIRTTIRKIKFIIEEQKQTVVQLENDLVIFDWSDLPILELDENDMVVIQP